MEPEKDSVVAQDTAAGDDFTESDFREDPKQAESGTVKVPCDVYQPPLGFKLIPETYVGVEPTMYDMMLRSLGQQRVSASPQEIRVQMPEAPRDEPDCVFEIRLLQQLAVGDIGYNFQRGEEFKYCPEKRYLEVGGDKYTTLRSFLNMWNAHYGPRPDPNVQRNPFFLILNPESCPPLAESLGRRVTPKHRSVDERIRAEENHGDAANRRVHLHGENSEYSLDLHTTQPVDPRDVDRIPDETLHPYRRPGMQQPVAHDPSRQSAREYNQQVRQQAYGNAQGYPPPEMIPRDPQAELQQMLQSRVPVMPARGGLVGPDGLTDRARMIKSMSGDQVQRPVQRQQMNVPIGGYEPPETVENFQRGQEMMGGGRVVAQVPGGPADEAVAQAQMMDAQAIRLQGGRLSY